MIKNTQRTITSASRSKMMEDPEINAEVTNNKNKNNLRCQFCNSLILKKQQGDYVEGEVFDLPLMHQKNDKDASVETEPQRHFWLVHDMFTFENIGFSNTVANRKFLTCADCDMGPVGYHEIDNKKCYIAIKRVRHDKPKAQQQEQDEEEEEAPVELPE